MQKVKEARKRYKPLSVKCLFIAEAPPSADSQRFFYFEPVSKYDSLFISMMKALYPRDCVHAPDIRARKRELLERFRDDGYYLIDASDEPIKPGVSKDKQLRASLPSLVDKVNVLASDQTKIILISKTVYDVCYDELVMRNCNVVNDGPIYFPINYQRQFIEKVAALI